MWQPIETAPKDGTRILVCTIHGEIELSDWFEMRREVYDEVGDGLYRKRELVEGAWNSNRPAFWMPLPKLPPETDIETARLAACEPV